MEDKYVGSQHRMPYRKADEKCGIRRYRKRRAVLFIFHRNPPFPPDGWGMGGNNPLFPIPSFWRKMGGIGERLQKGSLVSIQGRLEQDKWERDGKKHSGMKIAVDHIRLLGKAEYAGSEPDVPAPEDSDASEAGQEGV
jgi:hypothetical protein